MQEQPGEMAQRIRKLREGLGLSVSETARRAGISRPYLQHLERSERDVAVSAKVLSRLGEALKTSPSAILDTATPRKLYAIAMPTALATLTAYLQEVSPEPGVVRALEDLAMIANRQPSRDDWLVVHRALVGTILERPTNRRKTVAK